MVRFGQKKHGRFGQKHRDFSQKDRRFGQNNIIIYNSFTESGIISQGNKPGPFSGNANIIEAEGATAS